MKNKDLKSAICNLPFVFRQKGFTPLHPEGSHLQAADGGEGNIGLLEKSCPSKRGVTGFTLLELLAVIAILATALLLVFPKIHLFEDYTLNAEARRVAGLFRYAQESASARKMYYRLWFYPEKEAIEIESSSDGIEFKKMEESFLKGLTLKSGIDMMDIVLATLGKVNEGRVAVIFSPSGGAEPFNIHLKMGQRLLTIGYNPYSGKVKVLKGYV